MSIVELCVFTQTAPCVSAVLHGGSSSSSWSSWCACGEIRCHHLIQKALLLPDHCICHHCFSCHHSPPAPHIPLHFLKDLSPSSSPSSSFSSPPAPPFLPPLIIIPLTPYPFSSSLPQQKIDSFLFFFCWILYLIIAHSILPLVF